MNSLNSGTGAASPKPTASKGQIASIILPHTFEFGRTLILRPLNRPGLDIDFDSVPIWLQRLLAATVSAPALRYLGVCLLAFAVATSSLTFNWVIEHNTTENYFPEFAGKVIYLSDVPLVLGVLIWTFGWARSQRRLLRLGPVYVFIPILILTVLSVASTAWAGDSAQAGYTALRRVFLMGMYVVFVTEATRSLASIASLGPRASHPPIAPA